MCFFFNFVSLHFKLFFNIQLPSLWSLCKKKSKTQIMFYQPIFPALQICLTAKLKYKSINRQHIYEAQHKNVALVSRDLEIFFSIFQGHSMLLNYWIEPKNKTTRVSASCKKTSQCALNKTWSYFKRNRIKERRVVRVTVSSPSCQSSPLLMARLRRYSVRTRARGREGETSCTWGRQRGGTSVSEWLGCDMFLLLLLIQQPWKLKSRVLILMLTLNISELHASSCSHVIGRLAILS